MQLQGVHGFQQAGHRFSLAEAHHNFGLLIGIKDVLRQLQKGFFCLLIVDAPLRLGANTHVIHAQFQCGYALITVESCK